MPRAAQDWSHRARRVMERCRSLAECTEEPGHITRTFLSPPMHQVHARVTQWMEQAGLHVTVDGAGNIRGRRGEAPLYIGSHLDTVPRAGMFDGILGVMMGIELAEVDASVEAIGFSEEEGVRFGTPFLGSRAFIGGLSAETMALKDALGITVEQAIRDFGLNPQSLDPADSRAKGYLEFHIEQGPVLDSRNEAVAVVDSIAGQSRLTVRFQGQANHAGTTPMNLRRDALAGAAEWIRFVETTAGSVDGLVATVGRLDVSPGATNVIAAQATASLDVRHPSDPCRANAVDAMLAAARSVASRRGLSVTVERKLDQAAVAMDDRLTALLEQSAGGPVLRMSSGAGHDAMVIAPKIPSAMLFLRSPAGVSHHPDESVLVEDVATALKLGGAFLERLQ